MKTTIKSWTEEERPREKMISKGCSSLSNSELLAILLREGTHKTNAVELGRQLLSEAGGKLINLSQFSVERLTRVCGVGPAKAVAVAAAFELGRRLSCEMPESEPLIDRSRVVADIMSPHLCDLQHEECWALFLNAAHRLTSREKVSLGGTDKTILDIKIIVKKAVERLASAVILVHNHPSGSRHPSAADCKQTAALRKALEMFDIQLQDHIIIAGKKYFSFVDENY